MKKLLCLSAVILACGVLISPQSLGQVKKGKERPLQTRHLMAGITQPNCAALAKALQGAGPADDKGWDAAAQNAELLNEVGHIVMADGRCPDATWAGAAKQLRECSGEVLKAVQARDAEQGRAAFGETTKACKTCHDAHRQKS